MTTYTDRNLYDRAQEAWDDAWARFYDARTHLFYDRVSSDEPGRRLEHLPTLEEIARQYPNTNGWATGMEDSMISAGVLLAMVCDRFDVTAAAALGEAAADIFAGMELCATASSSSGLVLRSVSPIDGASHYIETSRDQVTHFAHGLWRLAHSPLCTDGQRETMARLMTDLCKRLARHVVPGATDFHICKEDGTHGVVDKMWEVEPHEAARLPMIYAIGWDLTGERRWRDLYRQYAWPAARQSLLVPLEMRTPYALLQEQVSLEPLVALENEDVELKDAWRRAMHFVADRVEAFAWKCLHYRAVDVSTLDMDWRHWPVRKSNGYDVPACPEAMRAEMAAVRDPAEAMIAQLLCPGRPLHPDQLALLRRMIGQVDCPKCITYSSFYTQAAYWRAVKRDLIALP